MLIISDLISLLEDLTGEQAPNKENLFNSSETQSWPRIGFSQFNEIMLIIGLDRINQTFFQFLVDGKIDYKPESCIKTIHQLREGVERFQIMAMTLFGNIKYGFKSMGNNKDELIKWINALKRTPPDLFKKRHRPLFNIQNIEGNDTYFLGYLIEKELKKQLKNNPTDEKLLKKDQKRKKTIEVGIINNNGYLVSDHMDVYVATSMRQPHEYLFINKTCQELFNKKSLRELKLRWFDPTQAYCNDRIDKGLTEALMLKRAKCTFYLAQENDTLGKDSELASTLAQGKSVIAYIPHGNKKYVEDLISSIQQFNQEKSRKEIIIEQLKIFYPDLAWEILEHTSDFDLNTSIDQLENLLIEKIENHFNNRAKLLKEDHPLGLQVNLATGVANGVLVIRDLNKAATLIRSVILREMSFSLEKTLSGCLLLRERISGCIFRAITADKTLTNAFWNFYLQDVEN